MLHAKSQSECENPQRPRGPGNPGAWASPVDPPGARVEFLSMGVGSNGQVTENKPVGAGERTEHDSLFFNVPFATNSPIKIIKSHFFQSFWEKERFILTEIPVGMLN